MHPDICPAFLDFPVYWPRPVYSNSSGSLYIGVFIVTFPSSFLVFIDLSCLPLFFSWFVQWCLDLLV